MSTTFFTEIEEDRSKRFLLSLSVAERKFLDDAALQRGMKVTSLVRECLRKVLIEEPAPKEQGEATGVPETEDKAELPR